MKKSKKKPRPVASTTTQTTTTARQKAIREITSSVLDSCVSGGGVRSNCPHRKMNSY